MSASEKWKSSVQPRCHEMVHAAYDKRAGNPPHQCWFAARRDGYCGRHHPAHRLKVARRACARAEVLLSRLTGEIAELKARVEVIGGGQ